MKLIGEKLNPLLHDYNKTNKSKVLDVKSTLKEKLLTYRK